jgi:phosphoribosyl 1,2-cyclic phosphodiesterase
MRYYLLASGSNGNCTLIQTKEANILIDVGISLASMKQRLEALGLSLESIDAIFITHEHIDHVRSLPSFPLEKVYSGAGTCPLLDNHILQAYQPFSIKDMTITPIPLSHDCINGFGYVVQNHIERLVYLTDTGYVAAKNQSYIQGATHYVVESNHDVEMLLNSNRPRYLVRRILSDYGHLNNEQCGEMLAKVIDMSTKSITLAHLSEEANDPALALEAVQAIFSDYGIAYHHILMQSASRYRMTRGWEHETDR